MRRLSPLLLLGMLLLLMLGMLLLLMLGMLLLLMLGMLLLLMPVRWRQSISDHGSLRRRGEGRRAVVRVSRRDLLALWSEMSRLIAPPIRLWRCVGGVSSTYLLLLRRRLLVPLRRLGVRRRAHTRRS